MVCCRDALRHRDRGLTGNPEVRKQLRPGIRSGAVFLSGLPAIVARSRARPESRRQWLWWIAPIIGVRGALLFSGFRRVVAVPAQRLQPRALVSLVEAALDHMVRGERERLRVEKIPGVQGRFQIRFRDRREHRRDESGESRFSMMRFH